MMLFMSGVVYALMSIRATSVRHLLLETTPVTNGISVYAIKRDVVTKHMGSVAHTFTETCSIYIITCVPQKSPFISRTG